MNELGLSSGSRAGPQLPRTCPRSAGLHGGLCQNLLLSRRSEDVESQGCKLSRKPGQSVLSG